MLNYWPTKFQWFSLEIDRDSSIYILDVIFGRVYDVISYFYFSNLSIPEPVQIFANGKPLF